MEKKNELMYLRWVNNAVITIISSSCSSQYVEQVKRFLQKEKRIILATRPKLIAKYNTYMRGTDQMDQNILCYRRGIRGKIVWSLIK